MPEFIDFPGHQQALEKILTDRFESIRANIKYTNRDNKNLLANLDEMQKKSGEQLVNFIKQEERIFKTGNKKNKAMVASDLELAKELISDVPTPALITQCRYRALKYSNLDLILRVSLVVLSMALLVAVMSTLAMPIISIAFALPAVPIIFWTMILISTDPLRHQAPISKFTDDIERNSINLNRRYSLFVQPINHIAEKVTSPVEASATSPQ